MQPPSYRVLLGPHVFLQPTPFRSSQHSDVRQLVTSRASSLRARDTFCLVFGVWVRTRLTRRHNLAFRRRVFIIDPPACSRRPASPAGDTPTPADGANGQLLGRRKGTARRGSWGWSGSKGGPADGSSCCGKVLLTTGVSQPTVNPTWPVSETSWLRADAEGEVLDSTRCEFRRRTVLCFCG